MTQVEFNLICTPFSDAEDQNQTDNSHEKYFLTKTDFLHITCIGLVGLNLDSKSFYWFLVGFIFCPFFLIFYVYN